MSEVEHPLKHWRPGFEAGVVWSDDGRNREANILSPSATKLRERKWEIDSLSCLFGPPSAGQLVVFLRVAPRSRNINMPSEYTVPHSYPW